jgi:hypothetical protein
VTFSDWAYQPLLENWLRHVTAVGVDRIRVYCLDQPTWTWCHDNSLDAELLEWNRDLSSLWHKRLAVFNQLLTSGIEFIHSDTDAIWLRNPVAQDLAASYSVDIAFSQGTVWPHDVYQRWGFVLCCGWFWARATGASARFFQGLAEDVTSTGDDQISVNRLLQAAGIIWQAADRCDYELPFHDQPIRCWHQPLLGQTAGGRLKVALLPHRLYQRLPELAPDASVKHFLSPKRCEDKVIYLQQRGLWRRS